MKGTSLYVIIYRVPYARKEKGMERMIMIPESRYDRMVQSYDNALLELQETREQLQTVKSMENMDGYRHMAYVELMRATEEQAKNLFFFMSEYIGGKK